MSSGNVARSGAKPSAGPSVPPRPRAPIDERIEHEAEELACQLERGLLRAGRRFPGDRCERVHEIGAGEIEHAAKLAGRSPLVLKKVLSAAAISVWLRGKYASRPRWANRSRPTSVSV